MKIKRDIGASERSFMLGVIVLSASTVIVKMIGLALKIPLMSLMGAEGMGYYNSAYEIYALLCGVSSSGMPIAVSLLISAAGERGDTKRARGIYGAASVLMLTKGIAVCGGLALLAHPISRLIGNPQAYYAILAISPALLFSCVSGAVRGYFQGNRNMSPTAHSQLLEAIGKLIFGVSLAALGLAMGLSIALVAALAVLGVSLGGAISASYLLIRRRLHGDLPRRGERRGAYLLELLRISLPITLGSLLMGSVRMMDMTLLLRRLQDIGISAAQANRIYGSYTTLALPVYTLVPAFIPPISESLIPRLSGAVESGSREEQREAVGRAFGLTMLIAVPASMGISVYSRQIITLLFPSQTEAIAVSAPMLSALGVSVFLSCLITTAGAVLQAYRRVSLQIWALAAGAIAKAISAYVLIGIPRIGEMGAPLSTLAFNLTVLLVEIYFLRREIPRGVRISVLLLRTTVASVAAISLSFWVYGGLRDVSESVYLTFGGALTVAVVSYFFLAYKLGAVRKEDISCLKKEKRTPHNHTEE